MGREDEPAIDRPDGDMPPLADAGNNIADEVVSASLVTKLGPVPRLSIKHLLIGTALSAVYLALHRQWWESSEFFQEDGDFVIAALYRILGLGSSVIAGCYLLGGGVLILGRLRRQCELISQPGHVLLLIGFLQAMLHLPVIIVSFSLGMLSGDVTDSTWPLLLAALITCVVVCGAMAAVFWVPTRRWKLLFVVVAIWDLLSAASLFLQWASFTFEYGYVSQVLWTSGLQQLGSLVLGFWTVVVIVWDLLARARRDWLHWLGGMSLLGTVTITASWWLFDLLQFGW